MKKILLLSLLLFITNSPANTLTVDELNELKATIITGYGQELYYDYSNYLYQKEDNSQHREWILYLMTLGSSKKVHAVFDGLAFVEAHLWTEILLEQALEDIYEPFIIEEMEEGEQPEDETY